MPITPLNLEEALTLYNLIGKYLPDTIPENVDVLEYHSSIIDAIISDGNPEAYSKSLEIMTKQNVLELLKLNKYERSSLFIDCIVANQVWLLKEWLRKIGYGTSQ